MAVMRDRVGTNANPRRVAAIALTAVVHCLALLTLLLHGSPAVSARPGPVLATFDATDQGAVKPAVHVAPQPRKVVPPPPAPFVAPPPEIAVLSPVVATTLDQAEAQATSGGCDLTAPVQAALRASLTVQAALLAIPPKRRSVANAIALWDQQWVQPDALLEAQTLDTIRTTITATIAAASPECRMAQQAGPRLVYVPGQVDTTVLAFGSGRWTWQQVADSADPNSSIPGSPESKLALGPDPSVTISNQHNSVPSAAVSHP